MRKVPVEQMLKGERDDYSLVVAVAKRAREIVDETVTSGEIITEKPVRIALKEFENNKYEIYEPEE